MYKDVGKKIQFIGQASGWISLIAGILIWLVLITNTDGYRYETEDDIWGWIALVSGALGYVSSWLTYGFGQLIDDVHTLCNQQAQPANSANDDLPEL